MSGTRLTVLILGGYGTFGGRLAQLLLPCADLEVSIAGRSLAKAELFVKRLRGEARFRPMALDRMGDLTTSFDALQPDLVVDATGPFQGYGDDPYRVVKACLAAGANYLDLANGSDFVEGISRFDAEAQAKGLFILAGVSSFPVLTAAAVRALAGGMAEIDSVTGGIAPSPYAGVGLNVVRAVCGYAGQPIRIVRAGREDRAYALTESLRYTVAPPGMMPLNNTRFSLVEVPDLVLVPRAIEGIRSMWMGAGPVPEILHRALNACAWLVRLKLLPSIGPLARLCFTAINILRWGEHRGGMFVAVSGRDADGTPVARSWHLLAERDDGPLIPSMAIQALISKYRNGEAPAPGARPATSALELSDYAAVFAGRTIYTGQRDDGAEASLSLYRRLLGDAWSSLPPAVQAMHGEGSARAAGEADIETGSNPLAWLARRMMGFPSAGRAVPVTVQFRRHNGQEVWTRDFAGRGRFSSRQQLGLGRDDRLLVERFGPLRFSLALVTAPAGRLSLIVRRWTLFGVPLQVALAPGGEAFEAEEDGRFRFVVTIAHPLCGLIVRYKGWLAEPVEIDA